MTKHEIIQMIDLVGFEVVERDYGLRVEPCGEVTGTNEELLSSSCVSYVNLCSRVVCTVNKTLWCHL